MHLAVAPAAVAVVLGLCAAVPAAAQENVVERDFPAGGTVRLDLAAGSYRITGSNDARIRVEWSARRADDLARVRVRADAQARRATIETDGPASGLTVNIQLPRRSDIVVDLSAGELQVRGIEGSKDVSAWAGELDIEVGSPAAHRRVDASVRVGELNAAAFDVAREGLFRSFHWTGPGRYTVRVRLLAGELTLGSPDPLQTRAH